MPFLPPNPLTDPSETWEAQRQFLLKYGRHNGQPFSENLAKVLMLGIWLGARMALVSSPWTLALAVKGNTFEDETYQSIRDGLNTEYGEFIAVQCRNLANNFGFTDVAVENVTQADIDDAAAPTPITDDDVAIIMQDLDSFGGANA